MAFVENLLSGWEAYGVFDYVLPFLLIFAIVYGILTTTKSFGENKGVHLIIAIIVGLLALRLDFVQSFFTEVFPRLGVALAVILVFVIMAAVFIPEEHKLGWSIGFYSLGGVAALLVVFNSFNALNFFGSNWWYDWGSLMVGALLIIGVIIAISVGGEKKPKKSGS